MKKYVLITGGAGYIGTNLCPKLVEMGYDIVVVDDFANAKPIYIKKLQGLYPEKISVYKFDIKNKKMLKQVFEKYNFDGVIHLAGKKYVDESLKNPDEYLSNNVNSTKTLLDVMTEFEVKKLLFASTVTVYGETKYLPVDENHPLNPTSPYAESKKICEQIISDWSKNNTAIICRFANLTGANKKLMLGDDSIKNKSSLIPYICHKIMLGEKLMFNGNTHKTKDGTTIRDYIHVDDLTQIVANLYETQNNSTTVNIARGQGYSVLDILHSFETALGKSLDYGFNPPRIGDVAEISFSTKKLESLIKVNYSCNMDDIVSSALAFEKYKQKNQEQFNQYN